LSVFCSVLYLEGEVGSLTATERALKKMGEKWGIFSKLSPTHAALKVHAGGNQGGP
jgi:hypothetical protein